MGRIPDSFIDELLTRADIVEVIDRRLALRKAGREYQALCPFHDEKTPSFTVSPQKQFYHCFGCGAHGTALGFLMEYEGLDFPGAVEELASLVGLAVPKEFSREPDGQAGLFEVLGEAADWYRRQLRRTPKAIDYLKDRGLSGETAKQYGLGYAPPGWDGLVKALGRAPDRLRLLKDAGLVKEGRHGPFDLLRDRVVFPIRDRRGRVVGFGGRVMGDGEPKYLNSPETALFHKGRELYGLHEACRGGRPERLIVVEGYTDVLALSQAGVEGAVATLGTATTAQHVERLFRTADRVVYCYDGDRAGRQAAWKALEATVPALTEGRDAAFLLLPEGEDPDSIVRNDGREAFEGRLASAKGAIGFLLDRLSEQFDITSVDGRARLVDAATPLLQAIPSEGLRSVGFERLSEVSRSNYVALSGKAIARATTRGPIHVRRTPVRTAVSLLLQRPVLAERADPAELRRLDLPGVPLLVELVELLRARPHLNTAAVVESFRGRDAHAHLAQLAGWTLSVPDEGLEREFDEKLALICRQGLDRRLAALEAKDRGTGLNEDERHVLRELLREKAGISGASSGAAG